VHPIANAPRCAKASSKERTDSLGDSYRLIHSILARARPISELQQSIDRTRECLEERDKMRHIEEDTRFHGIIAKSSGNAELCYVLFNIQSKIWLFRCKTYKLPSSTAPDARDCTRGIEGKRSRSRAGSHALSYTFGER
jgi:hypothetical protein